METTDQLRQTFDEILDYTTHSSAMMNATGVTISAFSWNEGFTMRSTHCGVGQEGSMYEWVVCEWSWIVGARQPAS